MKRWIGLGCLTWMFASTPALAGGSKWRNHAYVLPSAGGNVFTPENGDPVTVVTVGGRAGIQYWEKGRQYPKLRGHARLAGDYVMSSGDVSGYEARLGNFMGPTWGRIGFTIGPDFFYNQYQYGDTTLPGTGGVGTPLTVDGYVEPFSLFAGIEPAWYFNDTRDRRDWSGQDGAPGFGHEFAYFAGAAVSLGGWTFGGSWRHSMTAYGEQNSFGVNARFDGELGGGKKGKKKRGKGKKRH